MPKQQLILLHNLNIKIQKDVFLQVYVCYICWSIFYTKENRTICVNSTPVAFIIKVEQPTQNAAIVYRYTLQKDTYD